MFARTTIGRMAYEEVTLAVAGFHAMITIISFWADFSAFSTSVTGCTTTMTVVGPTFAPMLTSAVLCAIHAVSSFWTGCLTEFSVPTGSTLTDTCYMMTFSTILAMTMISTI